MTAITTPPSKQPAFLRARAFYFLFYAGLAFLTPYLGIYYRSHGLVGWQIGILSAIPSIMILTVAPLWGAFADQTHSHRNFLALSIAGAIFFALVLSQVSTFAVLLPVVALYSFFAAPIPALADNAVMQMLAGQRELYAKQRLWGAIGWGLTSTFVGALTDLTGINWTFSGYAILLSFGLLVAWGLPFASTKSVVDFWSQASRLLANPRWLSFLAIAFVSGVAYGSVGNYLFLFLTSLGASITLMGLSLTIATVSELSIYLISGWLFQRWNRRTLFIFGLAAYVVRLAAYAVAPAPWAVLLIQLLHGLTFGIIWTAGVAYADEIAPPGLGATAQGTFSAMMMGLGSATGAMLAGLLIDAFGYHGMYAWMAWILFTGLIVFLLVNRKMA